MCGIFAYYNFKVKQARRTILQFLIAGLLRLEYRGYDSAGISIDSDELVQLSPATTENGDKTIAVLDESTSPGLHFRHSKCNGSNQVDPVSSTITQGNYQTMINRIDETHRIAPEVSCQAVNGLLILLCLALFGISST